MPGPLVPVSEWAGAPYLWKARLAAGLCHSARCLLKLYLVGDICGRQVEDFSGLVWFGSALSSYAGREVLKASWQALRRGAGIFIEVHVE